MINKHIPRLLSSLFKVNPKPDRAARLRLRLFPFLSLASLLLVNACSPGSPAALAGATVTASAAPTTAVPPSATPLPPTATQTATATVTPMASPTATTTLSPTPSETPTETSPPPTPSGEDAIYVYYILLGTDGPVSCGDSLVAANTGQWRTGDIAADVKTALTRLFFKREYFGNLYNPVFRSNLEVESVNFKAYTGEVSVSLTGTYVRSGDRCDDSRVRAQVWTTIRQFPEVKSVYILLNGNLLGDILATGK